MRHVLATVLVLSAGTTAFGGMVIYSNPNQFDWSVALNGDTSGAHWLDVTQNAAQGGGQSSLGVLYNRVIGDSTPHFNLDYVSGESNVNIARRSGLRSFVDEEGIVNSFWFARSYAPGATIGPGDDFAHTAVLALSNYYTDEPVEASIRPVSYIGLELDLGDGVHYGWIRVEAEEGPGGTLLGYRATSWGYESEAGVGVVVTPAPGGAIAGLLAVGAFAGRRRR